MARTNAKFIYDSLRRQIETSLLAPGMNLPGEVSLADSFGASRMTVRKALAQLEREGLIYCRPGVGSFVKELETLPLPCARKVFIAVSGLCGVERHITTNFTAACYEALHRSAQQHNCELVLWNRREFFPETEADAFFCAMLPQEELELASQLARRKPVLLLNRITDRPELSCVAVDYVEATLRVIRRMLQNGARRILFIGGSPHCSGGNYPHYMRERGYRLAHEEAGVALDEALILPMSFYYQDVVERLLRYQPEVVFVSGTRMMSATHTAIEVALPKLKKRPSLFCFDDTREFSGLDGVPVSCGRMPLETMCEHAIRFLAAKARGEQVPESIHEVFPMGYHISDCPFLI